MPGACCTRGLVCKDLVVGAHEHTGTAGARRHSLRNGLTAYGVLSLETNSSCLHRRRIDDCEKPGWALAISAGLTPATGCQDHTLLPYAGHRRSYRALEESLTESPPCDPLRAGAARVHRIPSHVRDDARSPLLPGRDKRLIDQFGLSEKQIIFSQEAGQPGDAAGGSDLPDKRSCPYACERAALPSDRRIAAVPVMGSRSRRARAFGRYLNL